MQRSEYPIIICPVYLNAKGYLCNFRAANNEYNVADTQSQAYICDMRKRNNILQRIKNYNVNKKCCRYFMFRQNTTEHNDTMLALGVLRNDKVLNMTDIDKEEIENGLEEFEKLNGKEIDEILSICKENPSFNLDKAVNFYKFTRKKNELNNNMDKILSVCKEYPSFSFHEALNFYKLTRTMEESICIRDFKEAYQQKMAMIAMHAHRRKFYATKNK